MYEGYKYVFSTNPTIRLRVFPSVVVRTASTHRRENSRNEKKRRKTFPFRFRFLSFVSSRLANLDERSSLVPDRRTKTFLLLRTSFEITIRPRRPPTATLKIRRRRTSTDERTLRRYRDDGRSVQVTVVQDNFSGRRVGRRIAKRYDMRGSELMMIGRMTRG